MEDDFLETNNNSAAIQLPYAIARILARDAEAREEHVVGSLPGAHQAIPCGPS